MQTIKIRSIKGKPSEKGSYCYICQRCALKPADYFSCTIEAGSQWYCAPCLAEIKRASI